MRLRVCSKVIMLYQMSRVEREHAVKKDKTFNGSSFSGRYFCRKLP